MAACIFPVSAFAEENPYQDSVYYNETALVGTFYGTGARYKTTTSKVYVAPAASPSDVTLVQTYCYINGSITGKNVNGVASLTSGTKYGITNRIYEDGDKTGSYVYMWLGVSPYNKSGTINGVWSPDWTGTGTVVIV